MELPLQNLPQANYQGNEMFKGITRSVVKFVSETVLKCSTKEAKDQLPSHSDCGRIIQTFRSATLLK